MAVGGRRVGAGRRRLPDSEKKLKGTYRADRSAAASDIEPDGQVPENTTQLNTRAQEVMDLLMSYASELDYIDSHHGHIFMILALRLVEVEDMHDFISKNGRTYITRTKDGEIIIRARPQVKMYNESLKHAHTLLSEVGLTPTAMARIVKHGKGANDKPEKKGDWDEF